MIKNIFFAIGITTSLIFSACTEEIELDLNSSDPQIVIEGLVPENDFAVINMTKSINFDQSNIFPAVEHAMVVLTDDIGNSETLTELEAGIYHSIIMKGEIGRKYSINISVDGKTFTSNSKIPNKVNFDSIGLLKTEGGGGGPGNPGGGPKISYQVAVSYKDPVNQTNYYRFVEYINNEYAGDFIFDDRLNNGANVQKTLRNFNKKIVAGDTIRIEMQCIDESVYNYFNSFTNLNGGIQNSTTPANPYTNIIGSKLGYFSAHTKEIRSIIIPN